jgi:hypothetical protein
MGSTLRNDNRHAIFLADIAKEWDKRPVLTFGELLAASLDPFLLAHIGQLTDTQIVEAVRRYTSGPTPAPAASEPDLGPESGD